jgi:hypothetical protein
MFFPCVLPCASVCPGLYLPCFFSSVVWHAQTADNNLPSAPVARADVLANVVVLHSSENSIALGGPRLGAEHLVELNYKSNLTPWLLVQPVVQWFVLPGGNPTR